MLEAIQADNLIKLTFLHVHGAFSSFKYPELHDIRTVPMDVLTLVDPRQGQAIIYFKKDLLMIVTRVNSLYYSSLLCIDVHQSVIIYYSSQSSSESPIKGCNVY